MFAARPCGHFKGMTAKGSRLTTQPGDRYPPEYAATGVLPAQDGGPTIVYVRDPHGRRWSRRLLVMICTAGVIVAIVIGLQTIDLWPRFANPFASETTDRSGPVLLESMRDLGQFVAAEGNFMVPVDIQESNRVLPDFLAGRRTLFMGAGSVDAFVDFSGLEDDAIKVSPDGRSVEITLPPPQLEKPSLDVDRSYVLAQERGLFNRVSDLVGGNANDQQQVYVRAEQKIAEAAEQSPLKDQAKRNTQTMLERLLHQLGFDKVTIVWALGP
jgi:hypothetical protein